MFSQQAVTAMYVICSARSKEIYETIFQFVIKNCKNARNNLEILTCDYDLHLISGIRKNLPEVIINGSWIHFIKVSLKVFKLYFTFQFFFLIFLCHKE